MSFHQLKPDVRTFCFAVVAVLTLSSTARPAQAAFHLWNIQEVYTNSSGSLQFIELHDSSGGQNFVGDQQIQVSNVGNTQTHPFTIDSSVTLGGNTLNHTLLFGTAGLQAAGGPAPDFIVPDGFLFQAGGTISFFGANSGAYAALPQDGVQSRIWNGGNNAVNSPTNYAGQTGVIVAPEPAAVGVFACGGATASALLLGRRRSAVRAR